jgi:hypothetical protein
MMQRPTYAVDSIDHTLAALELLTQREAMRLSDLAKRPDVPVQPRTDRRPCTMESVSSSMRA